MDWAKFAAGRARPFATGGIILELASAVVIVPSL